MSTIRCPECKMVNWATALNCKRCSYLFQTAGETVAAGQATAGIQPQGIQPQAVPDTFAAPHTIAESNFTESNFAESNYPPNYNEPQSQPNAFQPQIGWANQQQNNWNQQENNWANQQQTNQQYNQNYNQNYGQNNYQRPYIPAANPKMGLAVTSMILGILGIVTTIFLVGILLAPIGLILGIVALVKANKKPNVYGGKGFAIAGIATSGLITLFIPIVLAVAIPNIMAAKRMANEMSAVNIMQIMADAETNYRKGAGKGACVDIKTLIASNLIEGKLEKDIKNGYRFLVVNYPLGGCEITATPLSVSDGDRSFYFSTDDNLIRAGKKNGKPADKYDKLLTDSLEEKEEAPKPPTGGMPMEGAAISTLRTLQAAQATYMSTTGGGACCADFPTLVSLGLIKPDLADGEDMGYRFNFNKVSQSNFEITATPLSTSFNSRSFFISPLDGLRGAAKNGAPADKKDPPVE
jgi:hypothetical protein